MSVQFYLLPIQVVIVDGMKYRGPSYLKWRMNESGLDVLWSLKDYGRIDFGCVAVEATVVQHTFIASQANVYQFPENLDVTMTAGQRSTLSNYLEANSVPGTWVSAGDTFRTALRTIVTLFLFMQRLSHKLDADPLSVGWTLNTQFKNLSVEHQAIIRESYMSMGYDDSVLRDNWTLRVILKNASEQWGMTPIYFGFVTL